MATKMSPGQVDRLLDELCVELGFCLSPTARVRLQRNPQPEIAAMTDSLFRARRINSRVAGAERMFQEVLSVVAAHYRAAEDAQLIQKLPGGQPSTPVRRVIRHASRV